MAPDPTPVLLTCIIDASDQSVQCMSNLGQYFARKSCKFAEFLAVKMLVAFRLRTVDRWPVAQGGRISERTPEKTFSGAPAFWLPMAAGASSRNLLTEYCTFDCLNIISMEKTISG